MKKAPAKKKFDPIVAILLTVIAVFGLLTVTCYIDQYEQIYTLKLRQEDLAQVINEGDLLRVEYEKRMDYRQIEEYVSENLNMVKLSSRQTQYLVNEASSRTELMLPEEEGVLARITKAFSIILEYFN